MPGYAYSRLALPFDRGTGRALRAFRPDLVHVVTEGPLGAAGRRFAVSSRIPLVTSFHTDFPRYAAKYIGHWAVAPVRTYLRRFHGAAAATQTPSEATRIELAELGLSRAVVWGRGVDSTLFTPQRRIWGATGGHGRSAPRARAAREPAGGGKGRGHAGRVFSAGPGTAG